MSEERWIMQKRAVKKGKRQDSREGERGMHLEPRAESGFAWKRDIYFLWRKRMGSGPKRYDAVGL